MKKIILITLFICVTGYGLFKYCDIDSKFVQKLHQIPEVKRHYITREVEIAIKHLSDKYYFCDKWQETHDDSYVKVNKPINEYEPCMKHVFKKGE